MQRASRGERQTCGTDAQGSCTSTVRLRTARALGRITVQAVSKMTTFAKSINRRGRLSVYTQTRPPLSSTVRFTGIMKYRYDARARRTGAQMCPNSKRNFAVQKSLHAGHALYRSAEADMSPSNAIRISRRIYRNIPSRSSQYSHQIPSGNLRNQVTATGTPFVKVGCLLPFLLSLQCRLLPGVLLRREWHPRMLCSGGRI